MTIITQNKPVDIEAISKVEKEYDMSIPDVYKNFLLQYNGGYTSIKDFILPNGKRVLFDRFLGTKYDTLNIEDIHEYLQIDENIVPIKYFILGLDPFGNCFCIDRENGQFIGWYHDTIAEQPELICASFTYFINAILAIKDES